MESMHVDSWQTKMIGFGCDGANVNITQGGAERPARKGPAVDICFLVSCTSLRVVTEGCHEGYLFQYH